MSFLNICLTPLICLRADIQDDDALIMWSLNESLLPRGRLLEAWLALTVG